jgi:MSHA pilin protein MshC
MSARCSDSVAMPSLRSARGFTLVELIAVIIILGVLAVVALPRLGGESVFRSAAFHDEVAAALRHAQKSAVAHRRLICANFTATTVTLTMASANGAAACGAATLNAPNGDAAFARSGDPARVTVSVAPAGPIYFQPAGTATTDGAGTAPTDFTVTVTDAPVIAVVGATGYVR